ncbi:MAG: hypothetical protein QOJ95_3109 [Mycobacterium sp.]|nr:hypothetical protein [Mycobacterium sp.]
MLPSRPTLRGWNPDSLTASAAAITSGARSIADAVEGLDDACGRMPETKTWSGRSHDAATAMFGRAARDALKFSSYANAMAAALRHGSDTIGPARNALLNKADQVDAGPLNVTDQWVVLIDPVRMSAEDLAKLETLARSEQEAINGLLSAVGDADDATANAVVAAGKDFGFVEAGSPTDLGSMMVPVAQRPGDQVPDPRDALGVVAQEAIRNGDMSVNVRDVSAPVKDQYGDEVTTVTMQDGSKKVLTKYDPFDWPSKQNFASVTEYDKDGDQVSETSSWHDFGTDSDITTTTWPSGASYTMTMDSSGYRSAGFTTADGRHSAVPVAMIDDLSNYSGGLMTGLEKHIAGGGSLPMVTAESIENVGKATKFGGPALSLATTAFDMMMAETPRDACIAAVSGAGGFGGGWGLAEGGAAAGALFPPAAPIAVPVLAAGGAILGGFWGADLGKFVGEVVCPY